MVELIGVRGATFARTGTWNVKMKRVYDLKVGQEYTTEDGYIIEIVGFKTRYSVIVKNGWAIISVPICELRKHIKRPQGTVYIYAKREIKEERL
jgi:hypothetical protein